MWMGPRRLHLPMSIPKYRMNTTRGVHSLLYFAYTCVWDLFIGVFWRYMCPKKEKKKKKKNKKNMVMTLIESLPASYEYLIIASKMMLMNKLMME